VCPADRRVRPGQGHLTAIVVRVRATGTHAEHGGHRGQEHGWAIEHTNLGTIRLIDAGQERTECITAEPPDHPEPHKLAASSTASSTRSSASSRRAMTTPSGRSPRVRTASDGPGGRPDAPRRGSAHRGHRPRHRAARAGPTCCASARPGDVLKITAARSRVNTRGALGRCTRGRDPDHGTARSNCGAGCRSRFGGAVESAQAMSVRLSPLWQAPPAISAPERILADLEGVPVVTAARSRADVCQGGVTFKSCARFLPDRS